MRVTEHDEHYHAVLSLWPDSDNWPCDGEVDYAEATDDLTSVTFFNHYSCANRQTSSRKALDLTQWHNYAVEWTSSGIIGYLDGVEWFRDTDPSHQPPGPMHQTIQLDWFPGETPTKSTSIDVAWVRVYDTPSATGRFPATADVRLAAVGDMNPPRNISRTSASARVGASIASALAERRVDAFSAWATSNTPSDDVPNTSRIGECFGAQPSPGCIGSQRRTTTGSRAGTKTSTTS